MKAARKHAGLRKKKSAPARKAEVRISRLRRPEDLSLEDWQIALRRQIALDQKYRVRNIGDDRVFSEFEVTNPQTRRSYRVAIRGDGLGKNFCSCPDFAVNTLGTCKHVESLLARFRRSPKSRAALSAGFERAYSEIYLHYGSRREVRFKPAARCPGALLRLARKLFDERGILKSEAVPELTPLLQEAERQRHELRCYDDVLDFVAQVHDQANLHRRVERMFPRGPASPAFGSLLNVKLYPYQKEGALFAARSGRCVIADDMGLGKTVEAIAAAEILCRLGSVERVLVIAPTSLKHQWQREIERFSNRPAMIIEGLMTERARRYASESFFKITNYDVVHRDLEAIRRWQPDLVILDEAQRIKNWKTRAAKSVKQIDSEFAFVLTGTPLENRLEELYSIVEFVDRYRLGPMFRFLSEHQHVDDGGRVIGYRNLTDITRTLQPILIRRKKEEVLKDLPARLEKRFFVPMTAQQMMHHEENREMVARIVQKWRRYGFLSEVDQRRLQMGLQNMRMSCDSTYLLDQTTDRGVKADELIELLAETFEDPSAKVVVFSQWLRMHELIRRRLAERKWEHVLFHGGVPGPGRKALIDRFREDPACRLFLSTDAGGVGLNLQAASVVINMDQPWNPAVLEQRIGRVHRLGQERPVRVVHFISQGSIEEGMLEVLAFKKSMFTGVLDGGQDEVFLGGTRLNRFMESVERVTGAIPESMPAAGTAASSALEESAGKAAAGRGDGRGNGGRSAVADGEDSEREAAPAEEAWGEILAAGVAFLEKLVAVPEAGRSRDVHDRGQSDHHHGRAPASLISRDEKTGETYLRLPVPKPETLRRIVDLLAGLTKRG